MPFKARRTLELSSPRSTPRVASVLRRHRLQEQLGPTIEALRKSPAGAVPTGFIADYIALRWLEWHEGVLRATSTGIGVREREAASGQRQGLVALPA